MSQAQLPFAFMCLSSRLKSEFLGWVICLPLWPAHRVQWNGDGQFSKREWKGLLPGKKEKKHAKRPRKYLAITWSICFILLDICSSFQVKFLIYSRSIFFFFGKEWLTKFLIKYIHSFAYLCTHGFICSNKYQLWQGRHYYLPGEPEQPGKLWSDIVLLLKNKFFKSVRQRVFYSLNLTS